MEVSETVGKAEIAVVRHAGARGRYFVPYRTHEASAKGNGKDFFDLSGELVFDNNDTWCPALLGPAFPHSSPLLVVLVLVLVVCFVFACAFGSFVTRVSVATQGHC